MRALTETDGCRMMLRRLIFSFVAIFLADCLLDAQIRILPRERLESVANPRLSPDSSWLHFDTKRHVAHMNEDDVPPVFNYKVKNAGPQRIQIRRLVSTCSCAVAVCDRQELEPGDSAVISVTYNPKGHPGKFERRIFVYTREGTEPAAILSLSAEVTVGSDFSSLYRYQIGPVRLRRNTIVFPEGQRAVEEIPFVNLGKAPLKLECERMLLPECLDFTVEPSEVETGKEGKIRVTYHPEKDKGHEIMHIILKGLGVPPSKSSIIINIKK